MQATSLQSPALGRSRFSKALPAPPMFDAGTVATPPPRTLPSLPPWPPKETPPITASTLPSWPPKEKEPVKAADLPSWPPKEREPVKAADLPSWPPKEREPLKAAELPSWPPKEKEPVNAASLAPWPPKEKEKMTLPSSLTAPDSPLPPIPRLSEKAPAPAPPPMSISRRPVAKQVPPPEPPSPSGSLSSLLSAYSRSSGESLVQSSDGTRSSKASEPTLSPTQDAPPESKRKELLTPMSTMSSRYDSQQVVSPLRKPSVSEEERNLPPPPPLSRDASRPQTPSKNDVRPSDAQPESTLQNSSPSQQPQLWRRRSWKGHPRVEVPELKLVISHGSTAATQPTMSSTAPTISPLPQANLAPSPLQPPRSATGLPGRDIRPPRTSSKSPSLSPAPSPNPVFTGSSQPVVSPLSTTLSSTSPLHSTESKIDAPLQQSDNMGQNASALKAKLHTRRDAKENTNIRPIKSESALPQPPQRLPTPDYDKEDIKTSVNQALVSTISPAASPEPLPPSKEGQPLANSEEEIAGVPNINRPQGLPGRRIKPQASFDGVMPTSREISTGSEQIDAQDASHPDAATTRPQGVEPQVKFPPRTTSTKPRAVFRGAERAPATASPLGTPGVAPTPMRLGSPPEEETKYKELRQEDLPEPDARAMRFPTTSDDPAAPGAIFKSLPLKPGMFNCYNEHRTMFRVSNSNYPLTCQVCHRADTEDRHKCRWCFVSMCQPCFKVFQTTARRDLKMLADYIEKNGPVEEVVSSRPRSAEALTTVPE